MRLLLLAENWAPRVGGIERYLSQLASGLAAQGEDVTVVAPRVREFETGEPVDGVRLERRRFFWPFLWPAWLPLFVSIWRHVRREEIDVVLCGKALFEGLVGYYVKKLTGTPYVVFTYAMEVAAWNASGRQRRKLEKVLRAADQVVYINEVTKQALLNLGVTEEQLVSLQPGVSEEAFTPVSADVQKEVHAHYGISGSYVLAVGRLIERKGFDTLLEAFSKLDQTRFGEYQLVIVGEGPEREGLEALARKLWLDKSVRLVGGVSDAHLRALYAGAAVFALTPREVAGDIEGFGIVYLEAAAQGVPAIATNSGGAAEAVVDGETGLVVVPDSVDEATGALAKLLGDDALRARLGTAARERTRDEFGWRERVEKLRGIIQKATLG